MKLSIHTPLGVYKYTMVPLFEGVKTINKEISKRNLEEFYDLLIGSGITVQLAYGTLLGAVREHDFIDHDEDIDLIMMDEFLPNLLSCLFKLRDAGFEVARYDRRGVMSFMREGEYIDLYIFSPRPDGISQMGREIFPTKMITELNEITFLGKKYLAPNNLNDYMVYSYGESWETPIVYYHPEQPKWKRCLGTLLQYIKEFLPDWLFFALVANKDKKYRAKFEARIGRFM